MWLWSCFQNLYKHTMVDIGNKSKLSNFYSLWFVVQQKERLKIFCTLVTLTKQLFWRSWIVPKRSRNLLNQGRGHISHSMGKPWQWSLLSHPWGHEFRLRLVSSCLVAMLYIWDQTISKWVSERKLVMWLECFLAIMTSLWHAFLLIRYAGELSMFVTIFTSCCIQWPLGFPVFLSLAYIHMHSWPHQGSHVLLHTKMKNGLLKSNEVEIF